MKEVVGIVGDGSSYWLRLLKYINERGQMEAFLYTEPERMEEELARSKVTFLFLDDALPTNVDYGIPYAYFSSKKGRSETIYRFQPVECIYERMRQILIQKESFHERERNRIYGVYSPLGRSGKTSFACAYGREYSFFYIGMEEYGIKGKDNKGMSEILYHIRNRREDITKLLRSLSEEKDGLLWIGSPDFYQDIRMMETEDFVWWMDKMRSDETFPPVIVDIGTGCLMDLEILDCFDKVYVPVLSDAAAQAKMKRFFQLLYEVNGEMEGKVRRIIVPDMDWRKEDFFARVQYLDS